MDVRPPTGPADFRPQKGPPPLCREDAQVHRRVFVPAAFAALPARASGRHAALRAGGGRQRRGVEPAAPLVWGVPAVLRRWHPLATPDRLRGQLRELRRVGRLDPAWADRLRGFESISVRDENSRSIIKHALGLEPELVLDPCLQFPPRPEGRWRGPQRPFVAVYGHSFSPAFGREVRRWAASRGYPLLSIGYRNAWADAQWITAGPHDFAQGIARAEAVATNFFHGCIFALRNARPFVCETSAYRCTKVQNLMATIGGEQRLVSEDTPAAVYDTCLDEPLEPALLQRIDRLRRTSAA